MNGILFFLLECWKVYFNGLVAYHSDRNETNSYFKKLAYGQPNPQLLEKLKQDLCKARQQFENTDGVTSHDESMLQTKRLIDNWSIIDVPSSSHSQQYRVKSRSKVFVEFSSGLRINTEKNVQMLPFFSEMVNEPVHGYTEKNSCQALKRFVQRGILNIAGHRTTRDIDTGVFTNIMIVNVPKIEVKNADFSASAISQKAAEQCCSKKILNQLFCHDVIKEAAVEFHKRRKAFEDPSKDLDMKMQAYLLRTSATGFAKILDELQKHEENFY
uniref:Uncharacterized protein n=1 Tax=Ditylenchus dipsaci TaxID=166011 RepID=A0A915DD87_9BILA